MLHETGIDPALVELEVTERVIVEGMGEARATLDQVAALGVGIAIDDFGTGYSGLAYLKRFPIDTVKIDQSFVRDLTVDPDDAAIVTAIVAMAKSLGIDVVAEGVETEEQLEALQRLGCHRAQGYFLARPMSARDIDQALGAHAPRSRRRRLAVVARRAPSGPRRRRSCAHACAGWRASSASPRRCPARCVSSQLMPAPPWPV